MARGPSGRSHCNGFVTPITVLGLKKTFHEPAEVLRRILASWRVSSCGSADSWRGCPFARVASPPG
jgi:hypothetical protein